MTYVKFKKNLIDKEITDERGAKVLVTQIGLMMLFLAIGLTLLVGSIVSTLLAIVTMVLCVLCFFMLMDYAQQDKECCLAVHRYVRLWWLSLIFDVIVIILMKVMNFI